MTNSLSLIHISIQNRGKQENCVLVFVHPGMNIFLDSCYDPVISLRPGDVYMHRQIMSAFVQIMVCHLNSAKPLSESMLAYCEFDPWEESSVKLWSKYNYFHWRNYNGKCHKQNVGHFGHNVFEVFCHNVAVSLCFYSAWFRMSLWWRAQFFLASWHIDGLVQDCSNSSAVAIVRELNHYFFKQCTVIYSVPSYDLKWMLINCW